MMITSLLGGMGFKMALLAALVVAGGALFWYISSIKSERDTALAQVGALTTAHEVQKAAITSLEKALADWKTQAEDFQKTLNSMAKAQSEANKHARKLNDVLSKHDLERLSLAKPGLIERRINGGTASILRMFNDTTAERLNNSR
jgi:septation ring formation regulator EzrA